MQNCKLRNCFTAALFFIVKWLDFVFNLSCSPAHTLRKDVCAHAAHQWGSWYLCMGCYCWTPEDQCFSGQVFVHHLPQGSDLAPPPTPLKYIPASVCVTLCQKHPPTPGAKNRKGDFHPLEYDIIITLSDLNNPSILLHICSNITCLCRAVGGFMGYSGVPPKSTEIHFDEMASLNCQQCE